MCKLMEDFRDEIAKEVAVTTAVEAWREVNIPDSDIKEKIMAKYNLTESEALSYLIKKSA